MVEGARQDQRARGMAAAGSGEAKQLIATAKGHGGPLVVSLAANWFPLVLSSHRSPPSPSPARRCSALQLQMAIASGCGYPQISDSMDADPKFDPRMQPVSQPTRNMQMRVWI